MDGAWFCLGVIHTKIYSTERKQKVAEDDEEAQLRELQASLAM